MRRRAELPARGRGFAPPAFVPTLLPACTAQSTCDYVISPDTQFRNLHCLAVSRTMVSPPGLYQGLWIHSCHSTANNPLTVRDSALPTASRCPVPARRLTSAQTRSRTSFSISLARRYCLTHMAAVANRTRVRATRCCTWRGARCTLVVTFCVNF